MAYTSDKDELSCPQLSLATDTVSLGFGCLDLTIDPLTRDTIDSESLCSKRELLKPSSLLHFSPKGIYVWR